jgi:hypothetical protein
VFALYTVGKPRGHEKDVWMIVGSGDYRYRVNADWAKLPDGWSFKEVGGVGVDSHDNVYVFNRGVHPMMVFDREGNFLRSWGEGRYLRAHGVHIAPDDTMAGISCARSRLTAKSCWSLACQVSLRHS